VTLTALQVEASENLGTRDLPVFHTRFKGTLALAEDTFVQASEEDGVVILTPHFRAGAVREVSGEVSSRLQDGVWSAEFSLEPDPLPDLGSPRDVFGAQRLIVTGSADEAAFREERRRARDEEAQAAQARLRQEERAQQARLTEARQQAERVRMEAELEAQRVRAEAARQAELAAQEAAAKRAQEEAAAQQRREEAERAAQEAADAERRRLAEEAARWVEIPAGTELDVRIMDSLNSGTAQVEDRFKASLVEDLRIDDRMVVPARSALRGVVASVQPGTRTDRTARMTLSFDQLTVEEVTYSIQSTLTKPLEGAGLKGDAVRTGAGAGIGAIIGGILGGSSGAAIGAAAGGGGTLAATEGREIDVKPGTVVRVKLDAPVLIELRSPPE
jgi:hypothetical protein